MDTCELCGGKEKTIFCESNLQRARPENFNLTSSLACGKHGRLWRCSSCGLIFADLDEKVPDYKNLVDGTYQDERIGRARYFQSVIRRVKKFKKNGKILDIGAATGIFLNEARKEGFEIFGVEPSRWAVEQALKDYQIEIFQGTLEKARFPEKSFDVVTLFDVIEHLPNPSEVLAEANRILKDDGLLCLATPNIESLAARIFREWWWHIRPGHRYYFSSTTLTQLLEKTGFKILKRKTFCWYFSLGYLSTRLVRRRYLPARRFLDKIIIPINLFDSLEIFAKRIPSHSKSS